ncbi:glyoxalase [Xaviernesmea oryzae]|uniref:Glyoxalase n=1 Tax=Xaviernesmea oryzae TaxID=464029 RepID=A0A1Q9AXD9_9HYPH|nr:VOC family protein [Xaviernesmea oryzae]OLP60117.1 glyoxalase [Xaviernesmea oryzae]
MFDRRISLITLGVADVARATAFYESLGWTRSSASNPSITFIALKGIVLGLFSRDKLAADARLAGGGAGEGFSGVTLAHNLHSEAEVDEAYAFALARGARPVKPPEKVFWGGYSGYFADPDGHLWELAFNPMAPLDAEGHMQLGS